MSVYRTIGPLVSQLFLRGGKCHTIFKDHKCLFGYWNFFIMKENNNDRVFEILIV